MAFDVGTLVAGKYRVVRVLGQGGMGTVYLATHELLDCLVALKLLHDSTLEQPGAAERLLREGRALARLRGQHIARVLDIEASSNGSSFLVLEYLEGEDLGAMIKRCGPLPIDFAVRCILETCEALDEAHSQGIIHRDIKPSNLFFTTLANGTKGIKVIDFGIAKQPGQEMILTHSGSLVGSPCYMAPEQLQSSKCIDGRCDIWALGVVLYEMLAGYPPHKAPSVLELCASILESVPQSLALIRPEVPARIDTAVQKCLARNPDDRFGSVHELARGIADTSPASTPLLAGNQRATSDVVSRAVLAGLAASLPPGGTFAQTQDERSISVPSQLRFLSMSWIVGFCCVAVAVSAIIWEHSKRSVAEHSAAAVRPRHETPQELASIAASDWLPKPPELRMSRASSTPLVASVPPRRAPHRAITARNQSTIGAERSTRHLRPMANPTRVIESGGIEDPVLQYGHY